MPPHERAHGREGKKKREAPHARERKVTKGRVAKIDRFGRKERERAQRPVIQSSADDGASNEPWEQRFLYEKLASGAARDSLRSSDIDVVRNFNVILSFFTVFVNLIRNQDE